MCKLFSGRDTPYISEHLNNLLTGSCQPNFGPTHLSQLFVAIPNDIKQQEKIATFLNAKTIEIDNIISKKQKLIECLKEERTVLINEAVTKGLDKNAEMKVSNVEWLGEIPKHWELKKLKYVAKLKSGDTITSYEITDSGTYPVFGGGGLRGYTERGFTNEGNYVLIGRQGALCGNIKYGYGKFWASEHSIVVYTFENYEYKWLGELLRIMNLNQYSQSSAQPGISVDNIINLHIPVPPFSEQKDIVEFIETQSIKFDKTVFKIQQEIGLIKEYKTSLINEVVTGKIILN